MIPRIEQKLELSNSDYLVLLKWLRDKKAETIYPERKIVSRYFDTMDLKMFYDTKEGIVPRKKLRIRTYETDNFLSSNNPYNLEVKMTTENKRYKSIEKNIDLYNRINKGIFDKQYGLCFETVDVSYYRQYYLVDGCRVTIDRGLEYKLVGIYSGKLMSNLEDNNIVLEIKAGIETNLTFIANNFEFPRSRFSKYERAIDLLLG